MANRYCSNCGQALNEDSRFCPSCGRPAHETAHVPTPEADVPVPPPPRQQQASGSQSFAPTGAAPPQQRSLAGRLFVGCAGLIVLGFLFVGCLAVLGSGGGGAAKVRVATILRPQKRKNHSASKRSSLPRRKSSPLEGNRRTRTRRKFTE